MHSDRLSQNVSADQRAHLLGLMEALASAPSVSPVKVETPSSPAFVALPAVNGSLSPSVPFETLSASPPATPSTVDRSFPALVRTVESG